jgi:hypothetical protein
MPEKDRCIGILAPLGHLFIPADPWYKWLRPGSVILTVAAVAHILRDHPERGPSLAAWGPAMRAAVENPAFVGRRPEFKTDMRHWVVTVSAPSGAGGHLLVVAISLARPDGEESDEHRVVTVHEAKPAFFVRRATGGEAIAKERWIAVKQKTGHEAGSL